MSKRITVDMLQDAHIKTGMGFIFGGFENYVGDRGCGITVCAKAYCCESTVVMRTKLDSLLQLDCGLSWAEREFGTAYMWGFIRGFDDSLFGAFIIDKPHRSDKRYWEGAEDGKLCRQWVLDNNLNIEDEKDNEQHNVVDGQLQSESLEAIPT